MAKPVDESRASREVKSAPELVAGVGFLGRVRRFPELGVFPRRRVLRRMGMAHDSLRLSGRDTPWLQVARIPGKQRQLFHQLAPEHIYQGAQNRRLKRLAVLSQKI